MINRRMMLGLLAASPLLTTPAFADRYTEVSAPEGFAIGGYDPVAYFTKSAPVKGSGAHVLMWRRAIWRFATAEHMALFERNPDAYAPQYGGYCAYAMAHRDVAHGDPMAWVIHDGKLYLNNSPLIREVWKQDIPGNIALADQNWPDLLFG